MAVGLELEQVDDLLDELPVPYLLAPGRAEPEHRGGEPVAHVHVPAEHQVLQQRQVAEQLDVLEGPGHPHPRDAVRAGAHQVVGPGRAVLVAPVQQDVSLLRLVEAARAVEQARLPGPVGTDHRVDVPLPDSERDVAQGLDAPEAQRDVADLEQRLPDGDPAGVQWEPVGPGQHPGYLLAAGRGL